MKGIILVVCLLASFCAELDALKCNLCLGSFSSDCANNVTSAMTVQNCMDFPRGHFHGRKGRWPSSTPSPFPENAATAPSNSVSGEELTTPITVEGQVESTANPNYPHPHPHPHPHPKLDIHCVELKIKGNKFIGDTVERGCGYVRKGEDICKFIQKNKNVESCASCDTDQCN